jgi:hypothetical protein
LPLNDSQDDALTIDRDIQGSSAAQAEGPSNIGWNDDPTQNI